MGANTGVKYNGNAATFKDNIFGTGLTWSKGETISLPTVIAKEFLKHPSFSEVPGFAYVGSASLPGQGTRNLIDGIAQRIGRKGKTSVVATRAAIPFLHTFGTAKQFMSRTGYSSLTPMNGFTLTFLNWASNGDAEVGSAQASTVKAAIEYPLGTIAAIVTFGGGQVGAIPAGGSLESDPINVSIPEYAVFAVRSFLDAPGGAPYYTDGPGVYSTSVDSCSFGTTATDVTYSTAAIPNSNQGLHYRPSLIKGSSNIQTVLLCGDSRMGGVNDNASDYFGSVGEVARAISPAFAVLNAGAPGATLGSFVSNATNWAKRRAIFAGLCDVAISNLGINDVINGSSAATIQANYALLSGITGVPTWQCTLPPKTTSSDSWATVANQTVDANNSVRVAVNKAIRSGLAGISGFIEIADYVESARDSGKWKADGVTANLWTRDGLHEQQYANQMIAETAAFRQFALIYGGNI